MGEIKHCLTSQSRGTAEKRARRSELNTYAGATAILGVPIVRAPFAAVIKRDEATGKSVFAIVGCSSRLWLDQPQQFNCRPHRSCCVQIHGGNLPKRRKNPVF